MSSKIVTQPSTEQSADLPVWGGATDRWRENPERLAWTVILASFVTFLLLAVTIPLAVSYIVRYATVRETAQLQPTRGTLMLYPSITSGDPIAITNQSDSGEEVTVRGNIQEGNVIVATDGSTQGALKLVSAEGTGEVLGTVEFYAGARLEVMRIRRPYFQRSPEPYQVRLRLDKGDARIFTNSGDQRPLRVEIETPHGTVRLNAGSYNISVDEARTDIIVSVGWAALYHEKANPITVNSGLRAWMTKDELAQAPESAAQNLLRNGNFTPTAVDNIPAAQDVWVTSGVAVNAEPGKVKFLLRDGRSVAYFIRQAEDNAHSEVSITQPISKNVNVYNALTLQLDVNIIRQTVTGAGYLGSEFPLRVEINYTDIYGKELPWRWGFYYRDPEATYPAVVDGDKVQQAQWEHYESPNLLEVWKAQGTPAARINSIRIYASGHDYQSMISEVELVAN